MRHLSGRHASDRSCLTCYRRKVRCDKQTPCSACLRGQAECVYPTTRTAPRRARRTTMADVATRIAELQRSIALRPEDGLLTARCRASTSASATESVPAPTSAPTFLDGPGQPETAPRPLRVPEALEEAVPSEKLASRHVLLRNGTSAQYFNEAFLSHVIEEDEDQASLLGASPSSDARQAWQDPPFSIMGILSNPATIGAHEGLLHPDTWSKRGVMELWHIFVRAVDPGIKVLHIPTVERLVFTAISRPQGLARDELALVSCIYFAAVVSLDDNEVVQTLGVDRTAALQRFKADLHRHFVLADPLDHPTVTALQALCIYLAVVRAHNHGRSLWVMNGLALRMAQSLGLHRDGSKLGLRPFESEMRRRLWWYLIARDGRAAEDHGISSSLVTSAFDTSLPLNVPDDDLWPDMAELPPGRPGWTTMTMPLMMMLISQTMQYVGQVASSADDFAVKEQKRLQAFEQLSDRIEGTLQHCDSVVPLQRLTKQISRAVLSKLVFVTRQRFELLKPVGERDTAPREEDLALACSSLQNYTDSWSDELLRERRWWIDAFPPFHMLLYVFWHLCVCPESPNVDRAWAAANRAMNIEQDKARSNFPPSFKSGILVRMRKKAEQVLQASRASGSRGRPAEADEGCDAAALDQEGGAVVGAVGEEPVGAVDWSSLVEGMPDWGTLVEDLQLNSEGFL